MPVGGGLLAKAGVYGVVRLGKDFGVSIEAGLADVPQGDFRAASLSAALVWALHDAHGSSVPARPVRTDFSVGIEQFDAARHDGSSRALQADVLKADRFLQSNFYLSGQVQLPTGRGRWYSAALIGAGWMQPLGSRWLIGTELLAGASGGGGVDSHGSIAQGVVYAGIPFPPLRLPCASAAAASDP